MSEFSRTGKRISSRHHSSTAARQVEETRVPTPTYTLPSARNSPHEHHIMLNTPPGATSPTDTQSLHPDTTSPFASDNPTYSHSTTTTTTPTQTNTQHHHDIESGGATSTSSRSRDESLDDTILLMDRISALEQQLSQERTTVTNLSSTLDEERITFKERMLLSLIHI